MHRWPPLFLCVALALSTAPARADMPTDEEIHQILRTRIDDDKRGVGIVVGLLDAKGPRVVGCGKTALADGREVDGKTLFEIGSVTKVFTSLLLAEAVRRRQVALNDPVAKYLPPEVQVPASGQRPITLLDLATHRSGLPSFPEGFQPKDNANPYADLTVAQLYGFVSASRLKHDVGAQYEYSNLGGALLGQALANRAQTDYETLVVDNVCKPLGMGDTAITLTPAQRKRLAAPYDRGLAPAANWDLGAFAGAGGLHSDADDLLRFLAANLNPTKSPLGAAIALTHIVRNGAGGPATDIALGWHVNRVHVPPIIWHNGGTGGYRSFVGFDAVDGLGVVVLSNTANPVDDIGLHLLNSQFELAAQPKQRVAIVLKPEVADACVGRYAFGPQSGLTFSREGSRYFVQLTGQDKLEVYPETETDFFPTMVEAQISFAKDADGHINSVVLRQKNIPDQTAQRAP